MEDGVFEGFGGGPTFWTEGAEFAVEPGWVGGRIALTRPHLINAASQELRKAHEEGWGQGGGDGARADHWGRRMNLDSFFIIA